MARTSIVFCMMLILCPLAGAAEEIETLRSALESPVDNAAAGVAHKRIGDHHAARGEYGEAAQAYDSALSLARERFSVEERTGMAVTMSWGGRIREAVRELRLVLAADPGNVKARTHLAKALSWIGRTDEAIAEADAVLEESPDDVEALVAKAHALRYRGDYESAAPIYRRVLRIEDNFDARLGLAYVDLSRGDFPAAREGLEKLPTRYPYQEKEREELKAAIARTTRPGLATGYTYYRDTDDNRVHRYFASTGFSAKTWKFELLYRHTDARDLTRSAGADDLSLSAYSKVSPRLGVGAGVGATRLSDGDTRTFPAGHVRADARLSGGTIGIAVSRTVFAETAQLIETGIRFTNVTTSIAWPLPFRLSLSGSHSHKEYSDDNSSDDVQASLKYAFPLPGPAIGVGYRIRYLDFDRESGGGYFDPRSYAAHQAFATLYHERGRVYTYLEPFYGHQSFTRTGARTSDWFGGGNGVLGVRLAKSVSLEIRGESSDYAAGAATGFRHRLLGLRLNATF
jgi:tetratricopeptide (TPR) repeat protein